MGVPAFFPVRRLIFLLAAAFAALGVSVAPLWAQPTLISQPIPALNVNVGSPAQSLTLTNYIKNPNAAGTVVRIAVGSLSPTATTLSPSSMTLIGNIDIALTDSLTPNTVANFLAYISAGSFVDNIIHRSVPGFIIQGGGFNFFPVNASASAGLVPTIAPIPFEQGLSNVAGTIAMAQVSGNQNSATSQWFINLVDNSSNLNSQDGGFCAFGTVLGNGMAVANYVASLNYYDLTSYAANLTSNGSVASQIAGAWTDVPLIAANLSLDNFIFTNISKIPSLTFTVSSGNTNLVTPSLSGNVLTLTPVAKASGNTTITVTATDTEGATFKTTFAVTITAVAAPAFTLQPASSSVTTGQTATFTATASGNPTPTFQWQTSTNSGAAWSNLTDGNGVSGSATATLTIGNTSTSMSGNQFRVVATNSVNTATSNVATLTVQSIVQSSYAFQTLDEPSAVFGTSLAGMASGNIAGSFNDSEGFSEGFLYNIVTQAYTVVDEPNAAFGTVVTGISGGNIVGYYYDANDYVEGFLYNISTQNFTTINDPNIVQTLNQGTYPRGIDGTNLVGYYYDGAQFFHGFSYDGANFTTLDHSSDSSNWLTGISGSNIVGYFPNNPYMEGFLYNGTTYTLLDEPAAAQGTFPQAVSGSNVAGYYADASGNIHGFIYNGATYTSLDDPAAVQGPQGTHIEGISGYNVVGYYNDGTTNHGFIATLVVAGAPAITTQPVGAAVTPGQNVTLTSAASGTPTPALQWQVSTNSGSTWSNLTDGNGFTGSATNTLKISSTTISQSGYEFRLFASNSIGFVASNAATITVAPPPSPVSITSQPSNQTVTVGQTATIALTASGSPAPTYQWQRAAAGNTTFVNLANGSTYEDVTTATLFVANATFVMSGDRFQCVVTNSSGSVTSKAITLTVNKAAATVSLSNLSQVYNGTTKAATYTTNPVGLTVNVTYNGSTIPPVNAGSYAVIATVVDTSYAGTASGTLVISKSAQTITFGTLSSVFVGNGPIALTANASSGLPVTYASSNSGVATVSSNGTLTIVSKGTATITASQPGNANYNAAANVAQTLTVNQVPTFTTQPANKTVTAGQSAAFTVAVVGTAPITYQWQREAAGTSTFVNLANNGSYSGVTTTNLSVSNVTVAMSGDQFACVAINPEGTVSSNPATLTVNKASASVSLSNLTQTYTGTPRSVTVATNPSGLAFNLTYNGSATPPTLPGSYPVVVTITDPNHTGSATGTLVINKVAATVSLSNLSQIYDGTAKSATVTTNPVGLAVNVTYNGSTTLPVNGGSYAVVATITDPNSSGSSTGTLTITKATQTITFGTLAVEKVGNAAFALGATASSGLTVAYASSNPAVATVSGNTVTIVGKGTATITASQPGNGNYNAASNIAQTLTVNQVPAFTTQPANKTVTAGQAGSFTVAVTGLPTPTYQWQREAFGTSTFVNLSNSGSYSGVTTATLSVSNTTVAMSGDQFQCVAANSAGSSISNPATLTVNKAPATVTLSNLTQTYTGTPRTVTVATNPSGLAFNLTYNGSATAPTFPGSYPVVATVTDANHTGSASGTLVINKSTATVSLSNLSQAYDGSAKSVTVTTNPSGLAVNVTYNGSTTLPVNGGSYVVVATITDPNSAGSSTGTLTITKAAQTISFGALAVQKVGNASFALSATASSGLTVAYASSNPAVATVSGNTVTIIGKGTATITASQAGNSNYNAASNVAQTLTVNQVPAFTTQPANKTAISGQAASFTVAATGLPTPTYQWQRMAAGTSTFVPLANSGSYSGVGTATLSVSGTTVAMSGDQFQCVATNVAGSATSNAASLSVGKAPATVTLSNLTQTYTGAARTVTVATNPGGLAFNVTYNGSTTAPIAAGNYTVAVTITDANHSGGATGTLVVNKATATVTLSNLSQTYDGTAKSVTVTTNPTGLSGNLTYNGSTTPPTNAGSYPVVATVVDANYTGTAKGTLTIGKAAQIISFGTLASQTVGNAPFALGATASSGLAVTYSSSNTAVATVSNGTVTIVGKAGTATITASQSGNANYNAAANVAQVLTVAAASTGGDVGGSVSIGISTIGPINPGPPTPFVAPPIVWSIMNDGTSAAWVSGIDSSSNANEPSPTAADLPALLLEAMNLNITSPSSLLPSASVVIGDDSIIGDQSFSLTESLTLQYRQSKSATSPVLTAQYSTDDVNWIAVPAGDLTQLPDDDANTERWSASIAVPTVGPIYLRVVASQTP